MEGSSFLSRAVRNVRFLFSPLQGSFSAAFAHGALGTPLDEVLVARVDGGGLLGSGRPIGAQRAAVVHGQGMDLSCDSGTASVVSIQRRHG